MKAQISVPNHRTTFCIAEQTENLKRVPWQPSGQQPPCSQASDDGLIRVRDVEGKLDALVRQFPKDALRAPSDPADSGSEWCASRILGICASAPVRQLYLRRSTELAQPDANHLGLPGTT